MMSPSVYRHLAQFFLLQDTSLFSMMGTVVKCQCQWSQREGLMCTVCYICAIYTQNGKWTEDEQQTLKYVVAYQKHLAKLQLFVSFCNRVSNVVCSKFGILLKETSIIAASTSTDSETKYITDFISPWTYGFSYRVHRSFSIEGHTCVLCNV
jgi:hypothetical protein